MPEGAHLKKGEAFAEVEVMKMFMNVCVGEVSEGGGREVMGEEEGGREG